MAGDLLTGLPKFVFRKNLLRVFTIALVQQTHDIVEASDAARAVADLQIQNQADELPLGVVRDTGIRGMLVAAIILDPGIEAGVGNRFDEPPGSFLDALNSLGKLFQKLVGSYEVRPPNDAVAVVTGE